MTFFRSPRHGEHRFQHYLLIPEFLPDLRITAYIAQAPATEAGPGRCVPSP